MLKLDKKLIKVFTILVMIVMFATVMLPVFSADQGTIAPGQVVTHSTGQNIGGLNDLLGTILGAVQIVGSFAAVIVLVVVGVRYMTGSVEEKAEYKKTMIPYVVGAILVFAASNVAKVIYDVSGNIGG